MIPADPFALLDPKNGKPAISDVAKQRARAKDRENALSALGWAEGVGGDRLVYSTGELWGMLREPRE